MNPSGSSSSPLPSGSSKGNSGSGLSIDEKRAAFEKRRAERHAAEEAEALKVAGGDSTPQSAPKKPATPATIPEAAQEPDQSKNECDFRKAFGLKETNSKLNMGPMKMFTESSVDDTDNDKVPNKIDFLRKDTRDEMSREELWGEAALPEWKAILSAIEKAPHVLDMEPTLVHQEYRHADRPVGFYRKSDKYRKGNVNPATWKITTISVWDEDPKKTRVFGDILPALKESGKENIRVRMICDSQMPYLQLKLQNPCGRGPAFIHIFANHLSQSEKHPFLCTTGERLGDRKKHIYNQLEEQRPNLANEARRDTLSEFLIKLHTQKELEESGFDYRTPIITGSVTLAELNTFVVRYLQDDQTMSDSANILAMFHYGCVEQISIYVGCKEKSIDKLKGERLQWINFGIYFQTVMLLALDLGNFWAIRKQKANPDWRHHKFPFDLTRAPRWLVTKWGPKKDARLNRDGFAGLVPEQVYWTSLMRPIVWPSPDERYFMLRLGVYRERQVHYEYIQRLFRANAKNVTARFRHNPNDDRCYVVELKSGIDRSKRENLLPGVGTRLNVTVNKTKLHGFVIKHPKSDFEPDFTAYVVSQGSTSFGEKNVFQATVKFVDDSTTFVRAMRALGRIEKDPMRKKGVHIRNLVLEAKIPNDQEPINPSPEEVECYVSHLSNKLDTSQRDAAVSMYTNPMGILCVHGSPGTGKTLTISEMMHALVAAGETLVVCAPTDEAVIELVQAWEQNYGSSAMEGTWCIWKDAYLNLGRKVKPQPHRDEKITTVETKQEAELRQDDEAFWKRMSDAIMRYATDKNDKWAKYGFAYRRWQRIHAIRGKPSHPLHKRAVEYYELFNKFGSLSKGENTRRLALENTFTQNLLGICKIVFTTCDMAFHEDLYDYFKPTVAFIDEAGAVMDSDAVKPLAAFQETLQRVCLAGDPKRQPPVMQSARCNEAYSCMTNTLFHSLVNEIGQIKREDQKPPVHMLCTQYRMHSEACSVADSLSSDP